MLTACAWRDIPAGPAPIVAGLGTFLGGWLGIGRMSLPFSRSRHLPDRLRPLVY
jgi:hypothetical protein